MGLFCPQRHLLLHREGTTWRLAERCPVCGWRLEFGAPGAALWEMHLEAALGGPSRRIWARPALQEGLLFLPLAHGELAALDLTHGRVRWKVPLPQTHWRVRQLLAWKGQLIALVLDERPLGDTHGLARVDPKDGTLAFLWPSREPLRAVLPTRAGLVVSVSHKLYLLTWKDEALDVSWQADVPSSCTALLEADGRVLLVTGDLRTSGAWVQAHALADGRQLWQTSLPESLRESFHALRGARWRNLAVWAGARLKTVLAVDLDRGRMVWQRRLYTYTPPAAGSEGVWVVARGDVSPGQPGRYRLTLLDPDSGETLREVSLARRVTVPPLVAHNWVVLFDDHGRVLLVHETTGQVAHEVAVGNEEDPPGTEPVAHQGILVVGTRQGRVAALALGAMETLTGQSPEALVQRGEVEEAALAYALQGDLRAAAHLYLEKLDRPQEALTLLEAAEVWDEALQLAREQGWWSKALELAQRAGDLEAQIEAHLQQGDLLAAARLYERLGSSEALERAADLYEQAGAPEEAWRLYRQLGKYGVLERLIGVIRPSFEDLQRYAEKHGFREAARLAMEKGLYRRAVEFFEQAEDWEGLLEALEAYLREAPEGEETHWAWARLARVCHRLGRYEREAEALKTLGELRQAAEAYWQAAEQADQALPDTPTPQQRREVARLYQKFLEFMGEELFSSWQTDDERVREARERILQLLRLPRVVLRVEAAKLFREGEFNELHIILVNDGYGTARDIRIEFTEDYFEVASSGGLLRPLLHAAQCVMTRLLVRPKAPGDAVPFSFTLFWKDVSGNEHHKPYRKGVQVRSRMTPHVHASEGSFVIIAEEIRGDWVTIVRGGRGIRMQQMNEALLPSSGKRMCPECGQLADAGLPFCPNCGAPLHNGQSAI